MSFSFRPATRENVSLLIGLSGASGSGKTYTAMRLAKGISGDKPFAVIDTEAGRSRHYADQFDFEVGDLIPPFRPDAYADAIEAADKAGYRAILLDSMSHEWAGEGGILDWAEDELDRMAGEVPKDTSQRYDWKRRDACKIASWIRPKVAHKQMVQRLLQVRAHLILCFRAEPKIEMVKVDGRLEIRAKESLTGLHGWIPICEKNLPYELTASFLLMPDKPGVPLPIKLQQQHRALFPLDQPITEDSGRRIAEWAAGKSTAPSAPPASASPAAASPADESRVARVALMQQIVEVGLRHELSDAEKVRLWKAHCGKSKPTTATVEQLTALLAAMQPPPPAERPPDAVEPVADDIPWDGS